MQESINNDLKEAMKNQDKFKLSVLRMLKSAIQLESINKKNTLTDDEVIGVIKKQIKMRNDSITEFTKYNKLDDVDKLKKEVEILECYLPKQLTEEEVDKYIEDAFTKINPTSMKDMGMIMKELNSIATVCDMGMVSKKVKDKIMNL